MQNNFYKRMSRVEAITNYQKSEMLETIEKSYKSACEAHDEEAAAYFARKIRDKLLDNSDKEMSLDRLKLDTSSAVKFIASIATIFKGEWAEYRQALRDLPEQNGFPFNVKFPNPPNEDKTDAEIEE